MTNITYRDLLNHLSQLTDSELDLTVSVMSLEQEEVWPVVQACTNSKKDLGQESDILDPDHPLLIIQ